MPATAPLVLVVDDVEDNRLLYVEYFRACGLETDDAADGNEALQKAQRCHPDVVVMDVAMPGMDGFEATRRLKHDDRTSDIFVVALTGHAEQRYREEAERAGVDVFVTKPCLPAELLAYVQAALEERAPPPAR